MAADRDDVFGFLSDLETHWLIADRFVEVVELEGPPGARTGGRVRVRGPLGRRLLDRLLLALGGMAWMRRRFEGTLRALDDQLRSS